jgi:hypothetical protein
MSRFVFVFAAILVLFPCVSRADEQLLTLFPKQRAAHQAKIDDTTAKYLARGHDYVDHLYASGGEEPMTEMEDMELDIDDSNTVPIDTAEVAKIIQEDKPQ